jgi:hypothetical protein
MLLWVVIFLAACRQDGSDPSAVLTRYLSATFRQDLRTAYAQLSSADRAFRKFDAFAHHMSMDESMGIEPLMKKATFSIETLEIDGDRGRAIVQIHQPDGDRITEDLLLAALSSAGSTMSPGEFDRFLIDQYRDRPVPMMTVRKGIGLVREAGGWRISAGWPQEAQVNTLLLEATRFEELGALEEAKAKYQAALLLNPNLIEVKDKIDSLAFGIKPSQEAHRDFQKFVNKLSEKQTRNQIPR